MSINRCRRRRRTNRELETVRSHSRETSIVLAKLFYNISCLTDVKSANVLQLFTSIITIAMKSALTTDNSEEYSAGQWDGCAQYLRKRNSVPPLISIIIIETRVCKSIQMISDQCVNRLVYCYVFLRDHNDDRFLYVSFGMLHELTWNTAYNINTIASLCYTISDIVIVYILVIL